MGWILGLVFVCFSQRQIGSNPTQEELSDLTRQTVFLRSAGRFDQALETAKKALALANRMPRDPSKLEAVSYLHTLAGIISDERGIGVEAELHFLKAVDLQKEILGHSSESHAGALINLATSRMIRGRNDLAEGNLVDALEILSGNYPESHPLRISCHGKLTSLYMAEQRNSLAIHHGKSMLRLLKASAKKDSLQVVRLENTLASVLLSEGKAEEAKSLAESALSTLESKLGKNHPATLNQLELMAKILLAEGDGEAAARIFDRIEKANESIGGLAKSY